MLVYLLKSSVCLLVLWLVYAFLLESQSIHKFKRFYLLTAIAVSIAIPFLTITEYVEPTVQFPIYDISMSESQPISTPVNNTEIEEKRNYLPLILWSIYGIGVLIFLSRFVVNLLDIRRQITKNEKYVEGSFIYVLLNTFKIPHSFFNYLFLNKTAFKTNDIPHEVLIHEQAHAKQWHSLDILLVELLQITLWFHPLVYILMHHIKLNHEFLADEAVLNQGTETKTYQKILLQFSSSARQQPMLSALNYSSFKKRFTVMKTQTSKTKKWLSTVLLIPIIAILFYNFSGRNYIELPSIPEENITATKSAINGNSETSSLFLVTVEKNNNTISVKCEKGCMWSHLKLDTNSESYIINDYGFSEGKTIDNDRFTFSIKLTQSNVELQGIKGTAWIDLAFSLHEDHKNIINEFGVKSVTKSKVKKNLKATKLIKAVNDQIFIENKISNLNTYVEDINSITSNWTSDDFEQIEFDFKQENCSKEFLSTLNELHKDTDYFKVTVLGSVPKSNKNIFDQTEIKTGFHKSNGQLLYYTIINGKTTYYNKNGVITDKNGKELIPGKQEFATTILPGQVVKRVYKDEKIVVEFKDDTNWKQVQQVSNPTQNSKTIRPVNVDIKKDSSLVLNGKVVKRNKIISEILKVNAHLTKEEQREYVNVSFIVPNKTYSKYVKEIQSELFEQGIFGSSIGYASSLKNAKLPKYYSGLFTNLTVEEAKAKKEKILSGEYKNKENNSYSDNSLKTAKVAIESVTFIPDEGEQISIEKASENDIKNSDSNSADCLKPTKSIDLNGKNVVEFPCINNFTENTVTIFNRWGNEVFKTNNYNNTWNGYVDGKKIKSGTYYYVITSPQLESEKAGWLHINHK